MTSTSKTAQSVHLQEPPQLYTSATGDKRTAFKKQIFRPNLNWMAQKVQIKTKLQKL